MLIEETYVGLPASYPHSQANADDDPPNNATLIAKEIAEKDLNMSEVSQQAMDVSTNAGLGRNPSVAMVCSCCAGRKNSTTRMEVGDSDGGVGLGW